MDQMQRVKTDEKQFEHAYLIQVKMGILFLKYLKNHPDIEKIKKFWADHTYAIKKFRRYPHRNKILGRKSTSEEIDFLKGPNSSW